MYGVLIDVYRSLGQTDAGAYRRTMLTGVAVQVIALIVFLVWRPKPPAERLAGTS